MPVGNKGHTHTSLRFTFGYDKQAQAERGNKALQ